VSGQPFDPKRMRFRHRGDSPLPDELEELIRSVIGSAMEVHRTLGPGYLEAVYEEALAIEFDAQGIGYRRQRPFEIRYRGRVAGRGRLDFLVEDELIIELKSVEQMTPLFTAQTISYLRATGKPVALLMNFNTAKLKDGLHRLLL